MSVPRPSFAMPVDIEAPAPPAHEQPDGQGDDDQADRRLGPLLDALRQIGAVEHDRNPQNEEARRVAETPDESEDGRLSRRALLPRRNERGHRCEVIGVARVTQSEPDRGDHHDQQRRSIGKAGNSVIETEHDVPFR